MDLSLFREDPKKQSGGTPIYLGDSTFFIKRNGTTESRKFIKELKRELFGAFHKHQECDDDIVIAEWLADYGVTGWENVTDGKQILEYSYETARKIFTNPEMYLSLNTILWRDSCNSENYRYDEAEQDEEALKKK